MGAPDNTIEEITKVTSETKITDEVTTDSVEEKAAEVPNADTVEVEPEVKAE